MTTSSTQLHAEPEEEEENKPPSLTEAETIETFVASVRDFININNNIGSEQRNLLECE